MRRYVLEKPTRIIDLLNYEKDLLDDIKFECDKAFLALKESNSELLSIGFEDSKFDFELKKGDVIRNGLNSIIEFSNNSRFRLTNEIDTTRLDTILNNTIKLDIIFALQLKVFDSLGVKVPTRLFDIPLLKEYLITGLDLRKYLLKVKNKEFGMVIDVLINDLMDKDKQIFSLPHFLIYMYSIKNTYAKNNLLSYNIHQISTSLRSTPLKKRDYYKERMEIIDHITDSQIFLTLIQTLNEFEIDTERPKSNKALFIRLFNKRLPTLDINIISKILLSKKNGPEILAEKYNDGNILYDESYEEFINDKYNFINGNVLFPTAFYKSENFMFKIYLAEFYSPIILKLPVLVEFYDLIISKSIEEIEKYLFKNKIEQLNDKSIHLEEEYLSNILGFKILEELESDLLVIEELPRNRGSELVSCIYQEYYNAIK